MEDINALNNKLQSISRTLEAAQSLAHQQEEAVRAVKGKYLIITSYVNIYVTNRFEDA